jgi:hypothetical protein
MPADFPARIGRYDVVGVIGSGRLGTVYKAFDQAHARVVGIRVLSPELLADPPRLERYRRGLRALAAAGHENLLQTIEQGQDGDLVYVVSEYVDGGTLFDVMERSRPTLAEAIHVLRSVADALEAAHRAGLVHGDLSPRSVFVARDLSVAKVGGFGCADASAPPGTVRTAALARARIASDLYRAPELSGSQGAVTVCSDVYSLGVIAYQAMTGKVPLGKLNLPSDVNRQVPLELDPIVLKCLATDPAQRYQSVAALLADLDKVEEVVDDRLLNELNRLSGGRLFAKKEAPRPAKGRIARAPLYLGLAAIGLVTVAVIGALLLRGRGDTPEGADAPAAPAAAYAQPSPAAPPPSAASGAPPSAPAAAPPPLEATAPPQSWASLPAGAAARLPVIEPSLPAPSSVARSDAPRAGTESAAKPAASAPRKPAPGPVPPAPDPEKSAGALYTEAQALIKQGQDLEARTKLALIGERYSETRWFVPAMMVKIDVEDRRSLREPDPVVAQIAPASMRTKRLLTERAPQHPAAEAAWWQLGESYDKMKRYDLAVQACVELATRFPNTRLDAWFKAGEISERRLKTKDGARAAYLKVPPTSARYREAQDRARKLAGR